MNRPFEDYSAAELGKEVAEGRIDPNEVVEYFIARIEKVNPRLNAFTYTKFNYARACAKELKEKISQGKEVGPFAGVPFALKDFLPSKTGWPASHGGVASRQTIDDVDSEFCKAMEQAGGIAMGKTNAPAYGFSGLCDNKLYGPTHNPFDLSRNSGGSSGGSAAAVAAGLLSIAEGGDAGGSIRIPAAWNNLFGFKASAGLIPSRIRPDAYAATHPYCCNGGLTKTVEDAAILLDYMAKFDPRDPTSVPIAHRPFVQEMSQSIKGKRIGYTASFGIFPCENEIVTKTLATAKLLEQAGAIVENIDFKLQRTAAEYMRAWCFSLSFDSAIEFDLLKEQGNHFLKDHRDEVNEIFARYVEKIDKIGKKEIYAFNLIRTEILDAFEDVFESYDAIVSPTALCFPPKNSKEKGMTQGPGQIQGVAIDSNLGFAPTFLVNFIGYPAASVPAGLAQNGLPVGMQIIAPRFQDGLVLAIAKTIEDIQPWRHLYPSL